MKEKPSHLYGVILAGGSGTRLWPLSTKKCPKQFLAIGAKESLMAQTVSRLSPLLSQEAIWVVCGKNHAEMIAREFPKLNRKQILWEPEAKNTAPALALASMHLVARDPEAVMVILPADHLIIPEDWEKFTSDVNAATQIARSQNALVTFGIQPDQPSTGFGYIERGKEHVSGGKKYFEVKAFHEKPDLPKAREYLIEGTYYWNSGMFIWKAADFLAELERCQPKMFAKFQKLASTIGNADYEKTLAETFRTVENISVDYAVMEKAGKVMVVPASFGWDDVGNLAAFTKVLPSDKQGNFFEGKLYHVDSEGNLVIAQTKPVALIGVQDLIVVDAPQATLVLPKEKAQKVKEMVELLQQKKEKDLL